MTERPIPLRPHEVRGILSGRQTQLRRVVKPQPDTTHYGLPYWNIGGYRAWSFCGISDPIRMGTNNPLLCPYGHQGDRLWVKETHAFELQAAELDQKPPHSDGRPVKYTDDGWVQPHYRATDPVPELAYLGEHFDEPGCKWRPSIHMPRWASRITLEITGVRVQRLQDISEADALAEGISTLRTPDWDRKHFPTWRTAFDAACADNRKPPVGPLPSESYRSLWESINGPGSWDANPLVWVIEFERVK